MRRQPLQRPIRQAVPPIVEVRQPQARRRLAGEVIVRVSEVLQPGQGADAGGNLAGEQVVGHIELLQAHHFRDAVRQRANQLVVAEVEDRHVLELADLGGQARPEPIVHEDDLVEVGHVDKAGGDAAVELVVGEDDDGDGGVAEIVGELEAEAVVVDEDGVQVLVEELLGDGAFELVEPQIQELERRQPQDHRRELAGEAVVAQIQLEEQLQAVELVGHRAAEAVGVDVEQCQVGEETELLREVPGDVAVVEVDAGDGADLGVVDGGRAVHARVVAHVRSDPVGGVVLGVRQDGLLPRLEGYVGAPDPWVLELERRVDADVLPAVPVLVPVVQQLALLDVHGLGVAEEAAAAAAMEGAQAEVLRGGAGGAEEEEEEGGDEEEMGLLLHLT